MNGKELLEAMSGIDEKYIHDAEAVAARRPVNQWRRIGVPLAAAACLTLVVLGGRNLMASDSMLSAHSVMEDAAYEAEPAAAAGRIADFNGLAESADMEEDLFAPAEMTVVITAVNGCEASATVEGGEAVTLILPEDFVCAPGDRVFITYTQVDPDTGAIRALTAEHR